MSQKMTKAQAVMAIVWADRYEGDSVSRRVADYKRTRRALEALDIHGEEFHEVMRDLEWHGADNQPWPRLLEALGQKVTRK